MLVSTAPSLTLSKGGTEAPMHKNWSSLAPGRYTIWQEQRRPKQHQAVAGVLRSAWPLHMAVHPARARTWGVSGSSVCTVGSDEMSDTNLV